MKDFDYQYQRIEKIKKMTAFLTIVIFLILGVMLYTGITYRSNVKKETKKQEVAKVEKRAEKSISEEKKLKVGEESTIHEGSYVSSDEEVVTIDNSGKIIAKKEGFATIVGNNKEGSDVIVVVEVKGNANETVTEREQPQIEQPLQEQPIVTQEEANTVNNNNTQTIIEEPNTNIDTSIVEENVPETNQDVVIENNNFDISETEEDITETVDKNDFQDQLNQKDTNNTETKEEKTTLGNWVKKIIDGKTYWYYYDEDGKAVTGWKELIRDGVKKLYYFDENGQMQEEKEMDNNDSSKEKKETTDNSKEETTKKKTNSADVNKLLKAAKEVTDYVRINRFSYGNAPINPAINHSAKLVSCDRCVGWALYKIGYTDQPKAYGLVVHESSMPTWLKRHNFTKITSYNDLKKGDIVFFDYNHNNDPDHVFIIGNKKSNGNWERYDCGNVNRIRSVQPTVEPISKADFTYAYRLPEKEIEE